MPRNENTLIRELKSGNAKAFEELYFHYHAKVYNFCYKIVRNRQEAEGLVQDVFVAIWENRGKLDEHKSFGGFIFRIARNKMLNIIRQKLTRKEYQQYVLHNDNKGTDLRTEVESRELMDLIQEAVNTLPRKTREIFLFSRNAGMTYKEIAQKMNISENMVDHEIRKATQSIREHLDRHYSS